MKANALEARMKILFKREQKLGELHGRTSLFYKQQKCARLANKTHDEYLRCQAKWYELKQQEEQQKRDDEERLIDISCHSHSCWEVGIMMRSKDYYAKDHFCDKCGKQLITEQEWENKIELLKIGIRA